MQAVVVPQHESNADARYAGKLAALLLAAREESAAVAGGTQQQQQQQQEQGDPNQVSYTNEQNPHYLQAWSEVLFPAWYVWWHIGLLAYHQQQQQQVSSGSQLGRTSSSPDPAQQQQEGGQGPTGRQQLARVARLVTAVRAGSAELQPNAAPAAAAARVGASPPLTPDTSQQPGGKAAASPARLNSSSSSTGSGDNGSNGSNGSSGGSNGSSSSSSSGVQAVDMQALYNNSDARWGIAITLGAFCQSSGGVTALLLTLFSTSRRRRGKMRYLRY
jgi:hypothetical protein